MKRYAYKAVRKGSYRNQDDWEKNLNALGSEGWRVVGFAGSDAYEMIALLERELEVGDGPFR